MENYTIYDEIGKGSHSVVYKARQKKTIDYVAVKSTDKSRMNKVLNEVQILHKLDHPNILKFHNWYESKNHIWLIFEYCTGGDLLNMITQDKYLPLNAVRSFGVDLVSGLYYLHQQGILFCGLKPSNVLFDEFGALKLADFGLSRPIPKSLETLKEIGPGSPHYMSPELFDRPAIHSFASDIWSLGCILFELATGKTPFSHQQFEELAELIKHSSLEFPSEIVLSPDFKDLVCKMLEKDPSKRLDWDSLISHRFWGTSLKLDKGLLPKQPLYEQLHKTEAVKAEVIGPKSTEKELEVKPKVIHNEYSSSSSGISGQKRPDSSHIRKIAEKNRQKLLMKKQEKMHRVLDIRTNDESGERTVAELESPDSRVNFKTSDVDLSESSNASHSSEDELIYSQDEFNDEDKNVDLSKSDHEEEAVDDSDSMVFHKRSLNEDPEEKPYYYSSAESQGSVESPVGASRPVSAPAKAKSKPQGWTEKEIESTQDLPAVPKTAPGSRRKVAPQARTVKEAAIFSDISRITDHFRKGNMCDNTAWKLAFAAKSDKSIKPIVCNKEIEVIPVPPFKSQLLNFQTFSITDLIELEPRDLERHLGAVFKALLGTNSAADRLNVLAYLYSLCLHTQLANLLINSSLTILLIRMLTDNEAPLAVKTRVLLIVGLLIRFATYIGPQKAEGESSDGSSGLVKTLMTLLRHESDRIRRRAASALGELLFYISTVTDDDEASQWNVGGSTLNSVITCLEDTDNTVRHYAVKAIYNILVQSDSQERAGEYAVRLMRDQVVIRLLEIATDSSMLDGIRASCAAALLHLLRRAANHSLLSRYVNLMLEETLEASALLQIITSEETTDVLLQPFFNLVILLVANHQSQIQVSNTLVKVRNDILTRESFVNFVVSGILQSPTMSTILRAKALLALYWGFRHVDFDLSSSSKGLLFAARSCDLGLMNALEKLLSRQDTLMHEPYLLQCTLHFTTQLVYFTVSLTAAMSQNDIYNALTDSNVSMTGDNHVFDMITCIDVLDNVLKHPFLQKQLKKHLEKDEQVMSQFISSLSSAFTNLPIVSSTFKLAYETSLLHVLQSLSEEAMGKLFTSDNAADMFNQLYPSITELLASTSGDTRLLVLRAFCNFFEFHFGEFSLTSSSSKSSSIERQDTALSAELQRLADTFVIQQLLPRTRDLLLDTYIIVDFVSKLLCILICKNVAYAGILHRLQLTSSIINLLSEDRYNSTKDDEITTRQISPNSTFLLKLMVESQQVPLKELCRDGLASSFASAFDFVIHGNFMTGVIMITHMLDTLYCVFYEVSECIRKPDAAQDRDHGRDLLVQLKELLQCTAGLVQLVASPHTYDNAEILSIEDGDKKSPSVIADMSTKCILLMAQLYGARFFDLLFNAGVSTQSSKNKDNLRFLFQGLGTCAEKGQLRILRTLTYAMSSKSKTAYVRAILKSTDLHRKINDLAAASGNVRVQRGQTHPGATVSSAAMDLRALIQEIRSNKV